MLSTFLPGIVGKGSACAPGQQVRGSVPGTVQNAVHQPGPLRYNQAMNRYSMRLTGLLLPLLAAMTFAAAILVWAGTGVADDQATPTTTTVPDTEVTADILDEILTQGRESIGPRRPEFTHEEWLPLDRPLDNTEGYDEQAFYILLRKAPRGFSPDEAVRVTVHDLLNQPTAYRGRPVKIELQFNTSRQFEPAKPEPYDKVHTTSGFVTTRDGALAVYVISPFQPAAMTQKQRFEATGYFYKLVKATAPGGGTVSVPVIIARDVTVLEPHGAGWDDRTMIMIMAVGGLIVVYIFVRTKVSRRQGPQSTYRPKRFEMTPEEDARSRIDIGKDAPRDEPK